VLALRPSPAESRAGPATVPVVVAVRDLAPGGPLTPADLGVVSWSRETLPDGVVGDPGDLEGRVLAGPVRRGEPLTDVRVVGNRLTDLLPPGLVAAPVRLADLAVSGLVTAGDRVDVLAAAPDEPSAELVAAAALVLAASGSADPHGGSDPAAGGLLLVAVDPTTAARLAAAATNATLTISLPGR
jgi:Flp pilus assembly protein CpaB